MPSEDKSNQYIQEIVTDEVLSDSSFLSDDFCLNVLGKPCDPIKRLNKKNGNRRTRTDNGIRKIDNVPALLNISKEESIDSVESAYTFHGSREGILSEEDATDLNNDANNQSILAPETNAPKQDLSPEISKTRRSVTIDETNDSSKIISQSSIYSSKETDEPTEDVIKKESIKNDNPTISNRPQTNFFPRHYSNPILVNDQNKILQSLPFEIRRQSLRDSLIRFTQTEAKADADDDRSSINDFQTSPIKEQSILSADKRQSSLSNSLTVSDKSEDKLSPSTSKEKDGSYPDLANERTKSRETSRSTGLEYKQLSQKLDPIKEQSGSIASDTTRQSSGDSEDKLPQSLSSREKSISQKEVIERQSTKLNDYKPVAESTRSTSEGAQVTVRDFEQLKEQTPSIVSSEISAELSPLSRHTSTEESKIYEKKNGSLIYEKRKKSVTSDRYNGVVSEQDAGYFEQLKEQPPSIVSSKISAELSPPRHTSAEESKIYKLKDGSLIYDPGKSKSVTPDRYNGVVSEQDTGYFEQLKEQTPSIVSSKISAELSPPRHTSAEESKIYKLKDGSLIYDRGKSKSVTSDRYNGVVSKQDAGYYEHLKEQTPSLKRSAELSPLSRHISAEDSKIYKMKNGSLIYDRGKEKSVTSDRYNGIVSEQDAGYFEQLKEQPPSVVSSKISAELTPLSRHTSAEGPKIYKLKDGSLIYDQGKSKSVTSDSYNGVVSEQDAGYFEQLKEQTPSSKRSAELSPPSRHTSAEESKIYKLKDGSLIYDRGKSKSVTSDRYNGVVSEQDAGYFEQLKEQTPSSKRPAELSPPSRHTSAEESKIYKMKNGSLIYDRGKEKSVTSDRYNGVVSEQDAGYFEQLKEQTPSSKRSAELSPLSRHTPAEEPKIYKMKNGSLIYDRGKEKSVTSDRYNGVVSEQDAGYFEQLKEQTPSSKRSAELSPLSRHTSAEESKIYKLKNGSLIYDRGKSKSVTSDRYNGVVSEQDAGYFEQLKEQTPSSKRPAELSPPSRHTSAEESKIYKLKNGSLIYDRGKSKSVTSDRYNGVVSEQDAGYFEQLKKQLPSSKISAELSPLSRHTSAEESKIYEKKNGSLIYEKRKKSVTSDRHNGVVSEQDTGYFEQLKEQPPSVVSSKISAELTPLSRHTPAEESKMHKLKDGSLIYDRGKSKSVTSDRYNGVVSQQDAGYFEQLKEQTPSSKRSAELSPLSRHTSAEEPKIYKLKNGSLIYDRGKSKSVASDRYNGVVSEQDAGYFEQLKEQPPSVVSSKISAELTPLSRHTPAEESKIYKLKNGSLIYDRGKEKSVTSDRYNGISSKQDTKSASEILKYPPDYGSRKNDIESSKTTPKLVRKEISQSLHSAKKRTSKPEIEALHSFSSQGIRKEEYRLKQKEVEKKSPQSVSSQTIDIETKAKTSQATPKFLTDSHQIKDSDQQYIPREATRIVSERHFNFPEEFIYRPCYCDENSQTRYPSILKRASDSKSMDSQPVKDTAPLPTRDVPIYADKTLQTSDDSLYKGKAEIASNTSDLDVIDRTMNSFSMQMNDVNSCEVQTSTTNSIPVEICYRPVRDTYKTNRPCYYKKGNTQELSTTDLQYPFESVRYSKPPMPRQYEVYRDVPGEPCNCCCQVQRKTNAMNYPSDNYQLELQNYTSPNFGYNRTQFVPCNGQCRSFRDDHPVPNNYPQYRPPPPPMYDFSSSDYDEDDDLELVVDQGEDSDGYSSDNSHFQYQDLPYQNNQDYVELVQELEESLQIRNKNRVQRALNEFEHNSKHNKPLEKPIIDYEETSESEEPIIRKISELTERRNQLHKSFPCKGRACCNCVAKADRNYRRPSPVRNLKIVQPPQKNAIPRPTTQARLRKARWQLDKDTGEWYKAPARRVTNLSTPQKDEHICGCTCTCGR